MKPDEMIADQLAKAQVDIEAAPPEIRERIEQAKRNYEAARPAKAEAKAHVAEPGKMVDLENARHGEPDTDSGAATHVGSPKFTAQESAEPVASGEQAHSARSEASAAGERCGRRRDG